MFLKRFIYLLFIFWLYWVFVAVRPFSLIVARATLHYSAQASLRSGFSCCGAQVPWAYGLSSYGCRALEHKLCSCGTWAYLLHSMWGLPASGTEPVSLALQGGCLTTGPAGKSCGTFLWWKKLTSPRILLKCNLKNYFKIKSWKLHL